MSPLKSKPEQQSFINVKLARRTSLIDRLVHESDSITQNNFDREEVRKRVVPLRSIFKDKATIRKALYDQHTLLSMISGNNDGF